MEDVTSAEYRDWARQHETQAAIQELISIRDTLLMNAIGSVSDAEIVATVKEAKGVNRALDFLGDLETIDIDGENEDAKD